jgi:dephospho-CoA kinase
VAERTPIVLGITGVIGSGKSLVGRILEDAGVPVIDTDKVVHELLTNETPTRAQVVERFGNEVQKEDGSIDRSKLGHMVFADDEQRKALEAIVHPAVRTECGQRVARLRDADVVAVLVPLLFEAGIEEAYDIIWTVSTRLDVLRERLRKRDELTDEQIDARLQAQWPQEQKLGLADTVIDNSGTITNTTDTVLAALAALKREALKHKNLDE